MPDAGGTRPGFRDGPVAGAHEDRLTTGGERGVHVLLGVPDEARVGRGHAEIAHRGAQHARPGLAARAGVVRTVRADVHAVEPGAGGAQDRVHVPVHGGEVVRGHDAAADAALVGADSHETAACIQRGHRLGPAGDGAPFGGSFDVVSGVSVMPGGWPVVDHAVAVEQYEPVHG